MSLFLLFGSANIIAVVLFLYINDTYYAFLPAK